MDIINIRNAKAQFAKLVSRAAAGEDVIVGRNGKPLVRITQLVPERRRVRFGLLKGRLTVTADFDAPLPEDVVACFEGR